MRLAVVRGTVTAALLHPSLRGGRFLLCQVRTHGDLLAEGLSASGEMLVAYDQLGAGTGQQVAVSEGAEATQPLRPAQVPIDAYVAALLDQVSLEPIA